MTRKHFDSIAASIRYMTIDSKTRKHVAEAMADTCALHNRNFDRDKFMDACGVA
jgi:hydroxylamine reductase (hybrid-cluster protein)